MPAGSRLLRAVRHLLVAGWRSRSPRRPAPSTAQADPWQRRLRRGFSCWPSPSPKALILGGSGRRILPVNADWRGSSPFGSGCRKTALLHVNIVIILMCWGYGRALPCPRCPAMIRVSSPASSICSLAAALVATEHWRIHPVKDPTRGSASIHSPSHRVRHGGPLEGSDNPRLSAPKNGRACPSPATRIASDAMVTILDFNLPLVVALVRHCRNRPSPTLRSNLAEGSALRKRGSPGFGWCSAAVVIVRRPSGRCISSRCSPFRPCRCRSTYGGRPHRAFALVVAVAVTSRGFWRLPGPCDMARKISRPADCLMGAGNLLDALQWPMAAMPCVRRSIYDCRPPLPVRSSIAGRRVHRFAPAARAPAPMRFAGGIRGGQ